MMLSDLTSLPIGYISWMLNERPHKCKLSDNGGCNSSGVTVIVGIAAGFLKLIGLIGP